MALTDLGEVIDQDHLALEAFMRGDPGPKKRLYSRGDDATLANPFGPPALGWKAIERTLDAAAGTLREGESLRFERVSAFATDERRASLGVRHGRTGVHRRDRALQRGQTRRS